MASRKNQTSLLRDDPSAMEKATALEEDPASDPHIQFMDNTLKNLPPLEAVKTLESYSFPRSHAAQRHFSSICCRLSDQASTHLVRVHLFGYALGAARSACSLAPQRIEYALHLAELLAKIAYGDRKRCQRVVTVCKDALAVRDPQKVPVRTYSVEDRALVEVGRFDELIAKNRGRLRQLLRRFEVDEDECPRNDLMAKKLGDRKKMKQEAERAMVSERIEKLKNYWKERMSEGQRREFFKVGVEDIKKHFSMAFKPTISIAMEPILSEALRDLEEHGTLRYWFCLYCIHIKFTDASHLLDHCKKNHNEPANLHALIPVEIDQTWKDMIMNATFKPIDALAAAEMVETKQLNRWPISEDQDRTDLLVKIESILRSLVSVNGLFESLLKKIIDYAKENVHVRCLSELQAELQVDETTICMCLLEVPELQLVLRFLQALWVLTTISDSDDDEEKNFTQKHELKERIYLDRDMSALALDVRMFSNENNTDDVDLERMMSWLYQGESADKIMIEWAIKMEGILDKAVLITKLIREGYVALDELCKKKRGMLEEMFGEKGNDLRDDCWTMKEYASHEDDKVMKIVEVDIFIIKTWKTIQQDEERLVLLSEMDYSGFVASFMRSIMEGRLVDQMDRDSMERSVAAGLEWLKSDADNNKVDGHKIKQKSKNKKKKNKKKKKGGGNIRAKVEDSRSPHHKGSDENISASSSDDDHPKPQQLSHSNIQIHEQVQDDHEINFENASSSPMRKKDHTDDHCMEEVFRETAKDEESQTSSRHHEHKPDYCQHEIENVDEKFNINDSEDDERNRKKGDTNFDGEQESSSNIEPMNITGEITSLIPNAHINDTGDHSNISDQSNLPIDASSSTFEQICDSKEAEEIPNLPIDASSSTSEQICDSKEAEEIPNLPIDASSSTSEQICGSKDAEEIPNLPIGASSSTSEQICDNKEAEEIPNLPIDASSSTSEQICVSKEAEAIPITFTEKNSFLIGAIQVFYSSSMLKKAHKDDHCIEEIFRETKKDEESESSSRHDDHKPDYCQQEKQDVEEKLNIYDNGHDGTNCMQEDINFDGKQESSDINFDGKQESFCDIEMPSLIPNDNVDATRGHLNSSDQSNLPAGASSSTSRQIHDSEDAEANSITITEKNSFLIAAIQSLWHFPRLSFEVSNAPHPHKHIGEVCAACELFRAFDFMNKTSEDNYAIPVDLTGLCSSFRSMYSDRKFFQEEHATDISDALEIIFDCLHRSLHFPICEAQLGTSSDHWDCIQAAAYGMRIYENINHPECVLCTSLVYNHISNMLIPWKDPRPYDFGTLLEKGLMEVTPDLYQSPSDPNAHDQSSSMGFNRYLVSLICSNEHSYYCFGFDPEQNRWILHLNNGVIKVIGCGHDLISKCKSENLLLKLMFFQTGSRVPTVFIH